MKEYLRSFVSPDASTPFYISLAGITYPDSNYRINSPKRDLTVIEYVLSGEGYILLDGNYKKVTADTIYLLNKGEHHEYFSDKNNPFSKIFLNISGSMAKELSSMYGLGNNHIFINKDLRIVFEQIPQILNFSETEEEMQIKLQIILTEILLKLSYQQGKESISKEAIILKDYIDNNIDRIIPNSELSNIIFRSVDYCQKLFLKEFNTTPYKYQINKKMMLAKNLLSNTDMTINAVGASLGYNDPHYFSNIFKSKIGCSPVTYKKQKMS